ncbi:serine hydrolase domain-containing protein [Brevibacillus brevis]|uniref:serine hydrolase domain-containing protein n=1 Tax=Brevibacillus brevis TaxID=1393 RepID=UPI000D10868E|nr:serine hydrolase domain-containing protein [Brevibacillus brevis]PSJ68128.1 penicillin-binding protein [Brevibacillus brevis]RED35612.1 CubicO group peptidase (beta-lactamase class C family) [Brevibacillus brevis]GEC87714.1 serine hydrolase [Brevibacillus brevis]VEF89277.1 Penicillin-binding protein E [Brevibacillus brevis]
MPNNGWMDSFEQYAQKWITKGQVPGVCMGIAKDGQIFYSNGFGFRDVEQQLGVTIDTVFGIGSITKSFTCVAVMQLQEAGKLSVHDPVVKYLPEFRLKNLDVGQITIHHFMTNTSGIPPLPTFYASVMRSLEENEVEDHPFLQNHTDDAVPIDTYEDLMNVISALDLELLGPPGTEFSYSNDCFALLGAIIERVSGKSYEAYVKEHIIDPIGMEHTSFFLEELNGYENITKLYIMRDRGDHKEVIPSPNWWDTPASRAAGFLKSTVRDMLRYTDIFCKGGLTPGGNRILTSESVQQMITPYFPTDLVPGQFYGYGLVITSDFYGKTLVEHSGGIKGVTSQMCFFPETGLAGVALSNLEMSPVLAVMLGALNSLENRPPESSHLVSKIDFLTEEAMNQFVGDYQSSEFGTVPIRLENGQLMLSFLGETYVMRPFAEDLFVVRAFGTDLSARFIRSGNNEIVRMAFAARQFTIHDKKTSGGNEK